MAQDFRKLRSLIGRVPGAHTAYFLLTLSIRFARYLNDYRKFASLARSDRRFPLRWADRYLCLHDRTEQTLYDRHYILHPAWAVRLLERNRPALHVDIASTLTFCSIVSAFIPVKFLDYRPAELRLSGLQSEFGDLMSLPFADQSVQSLSCMHVIEHIGLGRYGDPLDPEGDLKALRQLQRVVAPGGTLLIVVPVGRPRIQYNAHRIYSHAMIVNALPELELVSCALVPDDPAQGCLIDNPEPAMFDRQSYGCGCFEFRRPLSPSPR